MKQRSEWLVADHRGAFAMGACDGIRTRKYHGFFLGVPGRSQTAFLVDLEFKCNGISLWPHCYLGPAGPIIHPDLGSMNLRPRYTESKTGPRWEWTFKKGKLTFIVESSNPGGIQLVWGWTSHTKIVAELEIRGFWAMRDLHTLGGRAWRWQENSASGPGRFIVQRDPPNEFADEFSPQVHCLVKGDWKWIDQPLWYQNFHYSEELARGYPADEDLYSAGIMSVQLHAGTKFEWVIAEDSNDLEGILPKSKHHHSQTLDFVLTRPAGVLAGFPWFGEWGRDTFVSLPGIAALSFQEGYDSAQIWSWAKEVFHRWGSWIERNGMLPNVLEKGGKPQWDSADATLWWCHSLAALWTFSLCSPYPFKEIQIEFSDLLDLAIRSIQEGRHRHLNLTENGTLEVTYPRGTWMDAQIEGAPVTPRKGLLPEINALWFQARCLQWLWSKNIDFSELELLAMKTLRCREPDRPNTIFLHSLPLAPSFVLEDSALLLKDLTEIGENFWTPVGLRTLRPTHPNFKVRCVGDQSQRDQAYHQGPAWAWLGGHFEMAVHRLGLNPLKKRMLMKEVLEDMPIEGHIAEIFDAEPPFSPRGAPAQAWSLACLEEGNARRRQKVDLKVSKILAQRWLGRKERQSRTQHLKIDTSSIG